MSETGNRGRTPEGAGACDVTKSTTVGSRDVPRTRAPGPSSATDLFEEIGHGIASIEAQSFYTGHKEVADAAGAILINVGKLRQVVLPDRASDLLEALRDTAASLAAAISLLHGGGKKAAPSDKMFVQMLADYAASLERARTIITGAEG